MERIPEVELIAAVFLGYAVQWARAPKGIPNWLSWIGVAVLAGGLWFWMTPAAMTAFQQDWRRALVGVVMLALAGQGAARGTNDIKLTPGTNSL